MTVRHAVLASLAFLTSCGEPRAPVRYDRLPTRAYAVVAEVRAKPGREDEMRRVTLPLVEKVRGEPNNLVYFLHEERSSPGHFYFYEIFASQADFEAHNATPHVRAWLARLPDLSEGGVTVVRMGLLGNRPGE